MSGKGNLVADGLSRLTTNIEKGDDLGALNIKSQYFGTVISAFSSSSESVYLSSDSESELGDDIIVIDDALD